jgi:predicted nucleic acid-binding protein
MIVVDSSVWIDYFKGTNTATAGKLDALLGEEKGITVRKTIDAIIATYCIENKLPLLYADKDFQPFHQHLKLKNALVVSSGLA